MAFDQIHLRKLLKIMFLDVRAQTSAIRTDIREEIARESGQGSSGGDFYAPFWSDAKDHVFGIADLSSSTKARIEANYRRGNLYPLLQQGFLIWWNERRRWTNRPFRQGNSLKARFQFPGLDAVVKVDSILSVLDGSDVEHVVYPYWFNGPALSDDAARLGLWLLICALPDFPAEEIRILDVIRGRTFSIDRNPLNGSEEADFRERYAGVIERRRNLKEEY